MLIKVVLSFKHSHTPTSSRNCDCVNLRFCPTAVIMTRRMVVDGLRCDR